MHTVLFLEDRYNEASLLFVEHYKPQRVIYLTGLVGRHAGYFDEFKRVLADADHSPQITLKVAPTIDLATVEHIVASCGDIDGIHLVSSHPLLAIIAQQVASKRALTTFYTDVDSDRLVTFRPDFSIADSIDLAGITVDQYMDIMGGSILRHTTFLNEDPHITALSDFISENQQRWRNIKKILLRGRAFQHNDQQRRVVRVMYQQLNRHNRAHLEWLVTFLKHNGYAKLSQVGRDVVDLKFKTVEHKHFLFVTGSWLETLTYHTIKMVDDVYDVQTGVSFSWQSGQYVVKNEVDVLVSHRAKLYCFSCKDSAKYAVADLNELQVYAEQIGGPHTQKILVATAPPTAYSVVERAVEMGIKLIIFDGNNATFRRQIHHLFDAHQQE